MRLVERVGDDMEEREREEREAALQDHEAHLRHRRPGERGLHRGLGQHDERADERGEAADHHEGGEHARRKQHEIGEADQKKPARVDDAGVQQRRDGRRRLHDLRQPALRGELRRRQDGRDGDQAGGRKQARGRLARPGGIEHRRDIRRPQPREDQHRRAGQRDLAGPRDDEALPRRPLRLEPSGVEEQEPLKEQVRRDPGDEELHEAARLHQQEHGGKGRAEPAREGALPFLAVHVGPGVAEHDPADERDEQQHHRAHRVEPHRESQVAEADRAAARSRLDEDGGRGHRDGDRRQGRDLGEPRNEARSPAGIERGDGRGGEHRQRGEQRQEVDGRGDHRRSPGLERGTGSPYRALEIEKNSLFWRNHFIKENGTWHR